MAALSPSWFQAPLPPLASASSWDQMRSWAHQLILARSCLSQPHLTLLLCSPSAGITAASGICAELGIPLTHRGLATSVRYLTGHAQEGGEAKLDSTMAACADPDTTLVVYMGLATLPALTQNLTAAGLPPGTPAVAVERGTTPHQRTVRASACNTVIVRLTACLAALQRQC